MRRGPFGGLLSAQPYLLRTNPDGTREASARYWILVWVAPVLFLAGALYLTLEVLYQRERMVLTSGTVVKVYAWDNDAPQLFYPGETVYSPLYAYVRSDGTETQATAGTSHTGWNLDIGSVHPIRYWPDRKTDIVLAGPSEWWVARIIALIGAALVLPATAATLWTQRWLARGNSPVQEPTIHRM